MMGPGFFIALGAAVAAPLIEPTLSLADPVLHERIAPNAAEDLAYGVTFDGQFPAALRSNGSIVQAPDPRRPPLPTERAYRDAPMPDTSFSPDRDTRKPNVDGYDDPFVPSTAPYKRLYAYDAVSATYELVVSQPAATVVRRATGDRRADEDVFFADLVVDFSSSRRVRIPSVAPGAKLMRSRLADGVQEVRHDVRVDGAENWYVETGAQRGRLRLVLEIVAPRSSFTADFADVGWGELARVPPMSADVRASATKVLAVIGANRNDRPREAVRKLVTYFREFVDADEPPRGQANIYLDLALSKRGVCRHRAFAFLVTAQALGVPTRMVLNESHAWVEVDDAGSWRRIDLGGAGNMSEHRGEALASRTPHQPPSDAFSWPAGAVRGDGAIVEARARAEQRQSTARAPEPSATGAASSEVPTLDDPGEGDATDKRPPARMSLSIQERTARRGAPLVVKGEVRGGGKVCANVLVEVSVRGREGASAPIGTLLTDVGGHYAGMVTMPRDLALGSYELVVRTTGNAQCGKGSNE
jgi:hypothetical protein